LYEDCAAHIDRSHVSYIKYLGIALVAILVVAGSYTGYRLYTNHRIQAAQYDFGTLLDLYNAKQDAPKDEFVRIAAQAGNGYSKHKNTVIAPLFIALQSDALVKADEPEQALQVMEEYSSHVNTHTPFAQLFKTKQALLSLDSQDPLVESKGLATLQELAQDSKNIHRDYALYNLFTYYWIHQNIELARATGQELLASQQGEMRAPSPWSASIAEKLETLGS
jgi:hypothetical protein